MNLLSPIIYSPDQYFRNYLSQFNPHEVIMASPLAQRSIQQQQQQQQQQQHQQQQHSSNPTHDAAAPPAPVNQPQDAPGAMATSSHQEPGTALAATVDAPQNVAVKKEAASSPQDAAATAAELRLKAKRERNRRAAANCRRRQDEKLKKLEEENEKLRKTIEILQENLRMYASKGYPNVPS